MKSGLLLLLLFFGKSLCAQVYVSFAPALTNTPGTIAEKSNLSLELGKQWNVFSLGLDVGKTNLLKNANRDTTTYFEIRPNLNIFQQGKFTNTFTAGIGYILGAKDNMITELTSGIEYSWTDQLHINANFGQYFYSGRYDAFNVSFFGLSATYYFVPYKNRLTVIKSKQ